MTMRERLRSKKRELGLREGIIEKMTPTPSETTEIPKMEDIVDLGIARGTAKGPKSGQWYSVSFPKQIDNAVVVAVATGKEGNITRKDVQRVAQPPFEEISNMPNLIFPGVNFDKINANITIPKIERPDFHSHDYANKVADTARDNAKDIDAPSPLDSIWDWFCDTFVYWTIYYTWKAAGVIVNFLWDALVRPQINEVEDKLNDTADNINNAVDGLRQSVDDQVSDVVDTIEMKVDNRLNEIRNATNNVIYKNYDNMQNQIDHVQARVNNRLDDLYDMWGIPDNMAIAPVHIRNVDKNGFEWLSLGDMEIYWIAIGDTEFKRPLK